MQEENITSRMLRVADGMLSRQKVCGTDFLGPMKLGEMQRTAVKLNKTSFQFLKMVRGQRDRQQKLCNKIANHHAKVEKNRPSPLGENSKFVDCLVNNILD